MRGTLPGLPAEKAERLIRPSTCAPMLLTNAGSLKPASSAIMIAGFQFSSFIVLV